MSAVAPVTVVYLGGFGRSGSTLVERVLGAVPGWVNVGELVDLARSVAPHDERCGCGTRFSACPFWTEVGRLAFGGWTPEVVDRLAALHRAAARQRHLPGLLDRRRPPTPALAGLRAAYTRLYRAVAAVSGAEVVVDASKGPALAQAIAGAPGVDLRLLHVVRDPRAVAWSWLQDVERPHATSGTAETMWRISAHRSAAQWSALQLEVEAIGRVGGVRTARLRYEDLVSAPARSLAGATARLGVPVPVSALPVLDDTSVVLGPSHGLSGNPSRFRTGTVALRPDTRWTERMAARDRSLVTVLTLPLLRAYGYRARPGPPASVPAPTDHRRLLRSPS